MRSTVKRRLALTLLMCSGLVSARETPPPASPTLSADVEVATAGFYRLSWMPEGATPEAAQFELQEAASASFDTPRIAYAGPDFATTFTGRPDGVSYFRIRALDTDGPGPWSEAVRVEVQHHPLERAILFFVLGALVFVATLVLVLRGADRNPTDWNPKV